MPQISKEKREKISEQILFYLYSISPESKFTVDIARELARDEEFIKSLLTELKNKNLITEINKSPSGTTYTKRQRWRLSSKAYEAYKKHQ